MTLPALQQTSIPDPNKVQRVASNPEASVWVNASAGSGKTSVLTSRVMRLLLSGVKPEKILCLTYTRAGAAEMANRITATLSKWAVCSDEDLEADLFHLQDAKPSQTQTLEARRLFAQVLSCPGGLRIRTIHSFCQEILSRFPIEAGLPPHFALIEGQELDVLKKEVLDDLLREAALAPESDLARTLSTLVDAQGEHKFSEMLNEALQAAKRLSRERGKFTLTSLGAEIRDYLEVEPSDTPKTLRAHAMNGIPEAPLRQMATWMAETDTFKEQTKTFFEILAASPQGRAARFEDYYLLFLKKDDLQARKSFVPKPVSRDHPEVVDLCKAEVLRLRSILERIEAAEIAELTENILAFGVAFSNRLAERKASRAALDYDDLILLTEHLLRRSGISPWILYKLDNGLEHVLLDEAQDTSLVQWSIMESLTEEFTSGLGAQEGTNRTLFVVGDEKQSIFSFQNANPEAFLSRRDFFSRRLGDSGKKLEPVHMQTSFRSARPVLDAVDAVFELPSARISPDPIKHMPFPNKDGSEKIGRVEVWPLAENEVIAKDKSGEWLLPTTREPESDPQAELAETIAKKIRGWLTRRDVLPGEKEPISAGDIMILLRRRGRFADLMVRALKKHGVPVTGVDRMQLIKQLPVLDLLAMVRFALLPEDDLNLASLLRSPLIGLGEEQLMELAIGREGTLWESLKNAASFRAVRDYLAAKLNEADFSTPFVFLSRILNSPCPANARSGRMALWARLGEEALDPIEELLNKAQSFGQRNAPSLQNFLNWLIKSDAEIKREMDHGEGKVRIMTVHASKGLEAPIVFLPDTVAKPRSTDMTKFQWTDEGLPLFLSGEPMGGGAQRLWQQSRNKQLEEYRRLFYVAMTRASRRLFICGWQNDKKEKLADNWYGLAVEALRPLHQDFLPSEPEGPAPEIVFTNSPALSAPSATAKTNDANDADPELPGWALNPVDEQHPAVPAAPSFAGGLASATPDAAFARGRIIHRLLQSLPDIPTAQRDAAIARFLSHSKHALEQEARNEIAHEVQKLLEDERFSALFGPDSLVEAPLTGRLGEANVFRQVDRLCLRGNEVWIVDYKTNRPPPKSEKDIPAAYRRQMEEYRLLLSGIYPDKKVRCFLLWTYEPLLMEVSA
jgi:ATP-dependent helicase/nuclease subunit A